VGREGGREGGRNDGKEQCKCGNRAAIALSFSFFLFPPFREIRNRIIIMRFMGRRRARMANIIVANRLFINI